MGRRIQWTHVAALPDVQRNRTSRIHARIVESEQGYGLQLWVGLHDQPEHEPAPHAPAIVLYACFLGQTMSVLSAAHAAIVTLKGGHR